MAPRYIPTPYPTGGLNRHRRAPVIRSNANRSKSPATTTESPSSTFDPAVASAPACPGDPPIGRDRSPDQRSSAGDRASENRRPIGRLPARPSQRTEWIWMGHDTRCRRPADVGLGPLDASPRPIAPITATLLRRTADGSVDQKTRIELTASFQVPSGEGPGNIRRSAWSPDSVNELPP